MLRVTINPPPTAKNDQKGRRNRFLSAIRSPLFPVLPHKQWFEAPMRRSTKTKDRLLEPVFCIPALELHFRNSTEPVK